MLGVGTILALNVTKSWLLCVAFSLKEKQGCYDISYIAIFIIAGFHELGVSEIKFSI